MNKHYTSFKGGLLLVFTLLVFSLSLSAQTNFGAFQDNDFLNASNWTNGLPGPGNDANIGGGLTVEINAPLTVDFSLTSFSTINLSSTLTIASGGQLNNFSGSAFNIKGTGQLNNNGGIDQRSTLTIAASGAFVQGGTGSYSSTGAGNITNNGTLSIAGSFSNLGTLDNSGTLNIVDAANVTTNGALNISGNSTLSSGTITIVNGASLNVSAGATFTHSAGATVDNQGTLSNDGTYLLSGILTSNGIIENNGTFDNQSGGDLTNNFRFNNNGTFNNESNSNFLNEFEMNNDGTFNNRSFFDNGGAINNLTNGSFINIPGAEINNQFGSSINSDGIFSNQGDIISVGTVNNGGTFVNTGEIYTNTGGAIVNNGNFTNENLLSNLEEITNNGIFFNDGQLQNDSGGVFTNNGDLHNSQPARISNQFDLVNNQNLFNSGTIENGVRVFNFGFFENNGYLVNIGDFLNGTTGVFENTAMSTTAGSNGGVLENVNGGVFTNDGVLNNHNEIFNLACSSFVNNGIINNYYWWTNYGLFFNYGTFNELPYHQMNQGGGVEITGPTSDEVCEDVTISLDEDGVIILIGSGISTTAFDTCSTLFLKVNGEDEITLTCADIGTQTVTLEISDRNGNAVECSSTVTIVDDRSPEFENCPSDIIVTTTTDTAPADWTPPTFTDNCGPVNVTSTHDPGDLFPVGMTEVTYSATDGAGNVSAPCTFKVTVIPPNGDCADVVSVRKATSTMDNCGHWCDGPYALTFGNDDCYESGDDLLFVEYADGSALLTGSVIQNGTRGFVDVCFNGRTSTPPSGSPKLELCVQQGGNDWTFYTSFSGKITLGNGHQLNISRYGPAFQVGIGGNLQEPNELGGSAWFTIDGNNHGGDFNFRLGEQLDCQNSIYLEAECADEIGSSWTIVDDANASGGKALLPPNSNSYDYAPVNTADLITFNVNVNQAGLYRIFARASTPNGSSDSYWVRVNNGQWVKWNKINNDNYSTAYQWDLAGEWRGGANDIPLTFQLNAGVNTIQFSWREAWACLDKVFITAIAKEPNGEGGDAENCDQTPPPPPSSCEEVSIIVKTDYYGSETTWNIKDENGNVLISGGPYQDDSSNRFTENICLPDGCYTFNIHDTYGDGICCSYGNGFYKVTNSNGDVLVNGGTFGYEESKNFCINDAPAPDDCNKNALFVVGNSDLNHSDAAVKDRLVSLGYNVTIQDDDYCQTSDADDKGLILISSTVHSGKVGNKYRDVQVPVIVWEGWLMDNMKMTGTAAHHDYGTASHQRNMTIADGNHPIAQGGSGDVTIFDHEVTVTWGLPSNGASRIGHVPGAPDCVTLFAYDTDAHMVGMDAPARRVGFYLHNGTAHKMNNLGWQLFDRTIQWASGCDLGVYARVAEGDILDLAASASDNRIVNLAWKNNTGYKNDFFFLERSVDGRTWETINERNAFDEENNSVEAFSDLDPAPLMGTSFYRVSALLNDGTFLRSRSVQVEITDIVDYAVYPNPASTFTQVNLDKLQGEQNVSITVFDWTGKPIQQHRLDVVDVLDFPLDLQGYRAGIYSVTVQAYNKHPRTKKLIISK